MEGCKVVLRTSQLTYARRHYRDHLLLVNPTALTGRKQSALGRIAADQSTKGPVAGEPIPGYECNSSGNRDWRINPPGICPWVGCRAPLPDSVDVNRHLEKHMNVRFRCANSEQGCTLTYARSDLPGKHFKDCTFSKYIISIAEQCNF